MDSKRLDWMKREALKRTKITDEMAEKKEIIGERIPIDLGDRIIRTAFYQPEQESNIILFAFHGGGFVFGNYCEDDIMYNILSKELCVNVLSVGYRRAPQFPFPYGIYDCYDTIKYFLNNYKKKFNRNKIILFGCSAGANIASAVAILSNKRKEFKIAMQILNYPVTNMVTNDWKTKGSLNYLMDYNEFYSMAYLKDKEQLNSMASPIYSSDDDFDKNMISVIIPAENDDLGLCYEGVLFSNLLKKRGMTVYNYIAKNMLHGYFEANFRTEKELFSIPRSLRETVENKSTKKEVLNAIKIMKRAVEKLKKD